MRNLCVDIWAAEPGHVFLKRAERWKWAGEKSGTHTGWRATVKWPKEVDYGFEKRLNEYVFSSYPGKIPADWNRLADLWPRGELDLEIGGSAGSGEGASPQGRFVDRDGFS